MNITNIIKVGITTILFVGLMQAQKEAPSQIIIQNLYLCAGNPQK